MILSLRESVIKDILDTIEDVTDFAGDNIKRDNNALNVSSISRASKDLIMSFPVLCDNSIDPRTASMICKAIERKSVAMLQMIFASCSFEANNGADVLKSWHNNIDGGDMSLDDYLNLCDRLDAGDGVPYSTQFGRAVGEAVNQIKLEQRNGDKSYPVSSFSENSVNDYKVTARFGNIIVTEASQRKHNSTADDLKNQTEYFTKQLLDSDVKKCNELVPSLMIVRFNSNVSGTPITNQFVAGVKARLIPVDSYDIIDRINTKNKDRAGLVNLIRATTKEISFVKDYLLAIDKAKIEAKKNSVRSNGNGIWKTLEKRATKSVWKRLIGKSNDAGCITTLVISQQVVNALKKDYGVNMADAKTATAIMDAYNLLCVVIVDESTEVARFLYDGESWYEDISFTSLERETSDSSYKKVINLMSKMNRG